MDNKKYKDKYFSILGDSLSTFEGISQPTNAVFYDKQRKEESRVTTVSKTWWGQVIDRLGAKLLVNNSISGSMVIRHEKCVYPSYGCSDERTSALSKEGVMPDVIMVYLGTNDWGSYTRPRATVKQIEEQDLENFEVAYDVMLQKLRKNYPNSEIWCMTLATSTWSRAEDFRFVYYNNGWHISEYSDTIRKCAIKHGCKVIELFKNAPPYDTFEGIHPCVEGMNTLAEQVLKSLEIQ